MRIPNTFVIFILLVCHCYSTTVSGEHPTLIPGPGLPSLASLNLTVADIHDMPMPETSTGQGFSSNPKCGPTDDAYTDVTNLIYCFHYLRNFGKISCGFKRNEITVLCRCGDDCIVTGIGLVEENARSFCADVALGLLAVIDGCTQPDMRVAGFAVANGNGNIVVGGTSAGYALHWENLG